MKSICALVIVASLPSLASESCVTTFRLTGSVLGGYLGASTQGAIIGERIGDFVGSPSCLGDHYVSPMNDLEVTRAVVHLCRKRYHASRLGPTDVCSAPPGLAGSRDENPIRTGYQQTIGAVLHTASLTLLMAPGGSRVGRGLMECVATVEKFWLSRATDRCVYRGKSIPLTKALSVASAGLDEAKKELNRRIEELVQQRHTEIKRTVEAGAGGLGLLAAGSLVGFGFRKLRTRAEPDIDSNSQGEE